MQKKREIFREMFTDTKRERHRHRCRCRERVLMNLAYLQEFLLFFRVVDSCFLFIQH